MSAFEPHQLRPVDQLRQDAGVLGQDYDVVGARDDKCRLIDVREAGTGAVPVTDRLGLALEPFRVLARVESAE